MNRRDLLKASAGVAAAVAVAPALSLANKAIPSKSLVLLRHDGFLWYVDPKDLFIPRADFIEVSVRAIAQNIGEPRYSVPLKPGGAWWDETKSKLLVRGVLDDESPHRIVECVYLGKSGCVVHRVLWWNPAFYKMLPENMPPEWASRFPIRTDQKLTFEHSFVVQADPAVDPKAALAQIFA